MIKTIDNFRGDNYFLSNFYPSEIKYEILGKEYTFPTAEHLFQGLKILSTNYTVQEKKIWLEDLVSNPNPSSSKRQGRQVNIDVDHWNSRCEDYMRLIQELKYSQNPELSEKLVNTGDALLIEGNTWGDRKWGQVNGDGENLLGKILMSLRKTLKNS